MDDNTEIMRRVKILGKDSPVAEIQKRLEIGKARYNHGVRAHDDTTQWGTKRDSWLEMALEEIDDAIIYIVAESLRTHATILAGEYNRIACNLVEVRKQIVELG